MSNTHNTISKYINCVNVDTVKFSIQGMQFELPKETVASVRDHEGNLLKSYGNRIPMRGRYGAHNIHVRTLDSGKMLMFEGSPFAHLYGQNIFTSSDLAYGCRRILRRALKKFGINAPDSVLEAWLSGDIDLHEVHLAVNFSMKSESEVHELIKQIARQFLENGKHIKSYVTTVMLTPRNGTEKSMAFYAKGTQMRRSCKGQKLPGREKLIEECQYILRVELRLRASELQDLQLAKVSAWKSDTAFMVFKSYMDDLKLLSVTSGPVTEEDLVGLSSKDRLALALHKSGVDLSMVYEPTTLRRRINSFKKHGIDLCCPNQTVGSITSLPKFLSPKKVIKEAPQWMKELGIAPPTLEERREARKAKLKI